MATIFADHVRRQRLQQAVHNLLAEGFVLQTISDFHAELARTQRRLLIVQRTEYVVLDVDPYGHVQRTNR